MRELKEVNYLFSTLKKTKVVFIIGNHDYLKVDSYYLDFPWSENVTCLRGKECESVVFEDLDTEVYGLSYHTREIKEPKYNDLQPEKKAGFSILLGHGGDAKHKASRIWRMQDQIKKVNIRFCLAIQVMIIICRQIFRSCLKKALTILHLDISTDQR